MFKYLLMVLASLLSSASQAELRDPTVPGNLPPTQMTSEIANGEIPLNLTAIWISDRARHATINGSTIEVGTMLTENIRVLKIRPRYVLVRQNGIDKKLYLVPSVKKPVK